MNKMLDNNFSSPVKDDLRFATPGHQSMGGLSTNAFSSPARSDPRFATSGHKSRIGLPAQLKLTSGQPKLTPTLLKWTTAQTPPEYDLEGDMSTDSGSSSSPLAHKSAPVPTGQSKSLMPTNAKDKSVEPKLPGDSEPPRSLKRRRDEEDGEELQSAQANPRPSPIHLGSSSSVHTGYTQGFSAQTAKTIKRQRKQEAEEARQSAQANRRDSPSP